MKTSDSWGIYQRGHGGFDETMSFWRRQRKSIHRRLLNLERIAAKGKAISEWANEIMEKNGGKLF